MQNCHINQMLNTCTNEILYCVKKSKFNDFFHNLSSTAENSDFSLIALWWVHKCTYVYSH
jgi:hypothetical protein